MKRPLTGLVAVYAAGILLGSMVTWPVHLLFWITLALVAVFGVACRTRSSMFALMTLVFVAGILAYRHATASFPPNHISHLLETRDQNVTLRGVIISPPGNRTNETAATDLLTDRQSFRLELVALKLDGEWRPGTGKLQVFVSESRSPERFRYGDEIECTALLRVPPPARNPGTFDWRRWLARQGIAFTATLRQSDACTVLASARGNPVTALSLRLRERFDEALHVGLEDQPQLAGVLAGMIIGERAEIPPQTYADFQQTGVFHIFSVSGLNVTLVAVVVMAALRLVRVPTRWRGLLAIPVLILYVFATGGRPGAVRTLVMASVVLAGWALARPSDILNSLAGAALVILVCDPPQLFDGGFILSFAAVVALIVLTPPIEERFSRWCAPDPLVPRTLAHRWWRSPAFWLMRGICGSLAAWLGMLPLMMIYFNLFSPVSILANVAVIPLLGVITALGMVAMPAHAVWHWLALTFNNANFFLLSLMIAIVEGLNRVPFGHWFVQAPPIWATVGYYGLLVLSLSRKITWKRKRLTLTGAAVILGLALAWPAWRDQGVEITALDLRDGAAVFVNVPGERNDCLIDGGSDWSGERVVVPFLRAQGVDRLGAIVLTRGDKAHAAGLGAVMRQMPVARAIHSGTGSRSRFFWEWLEAARRRQLEIMTVRAGDWLDLGAAVRGRVLSPSLVARSDRSDDNALVLLLDSGGTRVLLMSDIGETVERRLLSSGVDLRAQVIIKGRHGEETSCSDAFLDAVRPELVVQSVGTRTSERYLQPDLRDRLQHRGIRLFRTDETGAVTIRLVPSGFTIRTWLAEGTASQ